MRSLLPQQGAHSHGGEVCKHVRREVHEAFGAAHEAPNAAHAPLHMHPSSTPHTARTSHTAHPHIAQTLHRARGIHASACRAARRAGSASASASTLWRSRRRSRRRRLEGNESSGHAHLLIIRIGPRSAPPPRYVGLSFNVPGATARHARARGPRPGGHTHKSHRHTRTAPHIFHTYVQIVTTRHTPYTL